jgi:hypothetical protein
VRLTSPGGSPGGGEAASVAVLPLRHLEVVEYPPEDAPRQDPPAGQPPRAVRHGDRWSVVNDGAADEHAEIRLAAPQGAAGPVLVNGAVGWLVRVEPLLEVGESVRIWRDEHGGLRAAITSPSGARREVPAADLHAGPLATRAPTPFDQPATVLQLARGRSGWQYLECDASRFDRVRFATDPEDPVHGRFAGGACAEWAVFDVSPFDGSPADQTATVLAGDPATLTAAEVTLRWPRHQPGAFAVNLPADLPARFGARFDQARLGAPADAPERFPDAVTEPASDPDHLPRLVNQGRPATPAAPAMAPSALVHAEVVAAVPIGWAPVAMPFRRPQRLTLGDATRPARIYLAEEGFDGFLELTATAPGEFGNDVAVTARRSGPGRFDVTVAFEAARFEGARAAVLGLRAGPSAGEILAPGPVGVLQAKAAGVLATATRDRTEPGAPGT